MGILKTKVTRLKPNLFGCRVLDVATGQPIVELRVTKDQIGHAFFDMLRTLDKLGYQSKMAWASRHRQKGHCVNSKYIWY